MRRLLEDMNSAIVTENMETLGNMAPGLTQASNAALLQFLVPKSLDIRKIITH